MAYGAALVIAGRHSNKACVLTLSRALHFIWHWGVRA